ncbi:MAG: hypothetical protein ACI9IA_000034 [Enterobacterales bacterium]|jgi:hypothetical protein
MFKQHKIEKPSLARKLFNRFRYSSNISALKKSPPLDNTQIDILNDLQTDGFAILTSYIPPKVLDTLRGEFQASLNSIKFATPCLAQSKIDPKKHQSFLRNRMLATPKELSELGLAIEKGDCVNYKQVLDDYSPSTLSVQMLEHSTTYQNVWLDTYLLSIISEYMGLVPQLIESYVRRNFPCPHRSMNHFWHRDLNSKYHLIKGFFFLNDCTINNGPHEYIKGSYTNKNKLKLLNDKRYYDDDEVNLIYPENSSDRILSVVPAGTIIIEDTRGLHRANVPNEGYRDLGYAVFAPATTRTPPYYNFPQQDYERLTQLQKYSVPNQCLV